MPGALALAGASSGLLSMNVIEDGSDSDRHGHGCAATSSVVVRGSHARENQVVIVVDAEPWACYSCPMMKTAAVQMTNGKISAVNMIVGLIKSGVPAEKIKLMETLTDDERKQVMEQTA